MAAPPTPELSAQECERIARALAEPRRMELLRQLGSCGGSTLCPQLFAQQSISAATMSHHLHELEAAGLISNDREGKFARITLRQDVLKAYLSHLGELLQ